MVEDFLLKSNLSLLNSGSPTYLHPATASFSAIDLSIAHPALYLDFFWQTDSDLHGSDHWSMVRKIAGKSPSCNIKHLNTNNTEITEILDIANSLGQTFSKNSSSNNYSNKFMAFINQVENQHHKFKTNNLETYNNPLSLGELLDAISKSHDSAVGPDDIHYQMLKHLPSNAVNICSKL